MNLNSFCKNNKGASRSYGLCSEYAAMPEPLKIKLPVEKRIQKTKGAEKILYGYFVILLCGRFIWQPDISYYHAADSGRNFCKWMDRCAKRHCNLCDNTVYAGKKRYMDERGF